MKRQEKNSVAVLLLLTLTLIFNFPPLPTVCLVSSFHKGFCGFGLVFGICAHPVLKPCQPEAGGWGQTLFMGLKIPVRRDFIAGTQKDNTQRCNIFPATPHTFPCGLKGKDLGCSGGAGFYW